MATFKEDTHQYFEGNKELISVTTLMRKHGLAPDYSGVSQTVLERKAMRGSYIHKEIELYNVKGEIGFTDELNLYIGKLNELRRQVLHSELMVNNDIVAGTIDLVFKDKIIADIKTTYQLHIKAIRWQISIYTYLHDKDHYNEYKGEVWWFKDGLQVIDIQLMPIEEVERLLECERNGVLYEEMNGKLDYLIELLEEQKSLENEIEKLKAEINEEVKRNGSLKYKGLSVSYTKPSVSTGFDTERFKKEQPELYNQYTKQTERKESFKYRYE